MFTPNQDNRRATTRLETSFNKFLAPSKSLQLNRPSESHFAQRAKIKKTAQRIVPKGRQFVYKLNTAGTTYFGNTTFPEASTLYTPATNFNLPGTLVVEPTLGAQSNRINGVNAREITFIIGNDASLITAGTLRYSTHTWGHRHWGGKTTGRPALDTAFVNVNNRTGQLTTAVDPQWARNDTTNLFSWQSSLVNAPKQILAGDTRIRFSNRGRKVSGQVVFYGNGFIEPGAYAYVAKFTGSLFR